MDEDEEFREPVEPILDLEPDAPDPTKGAARGARSGCLLGVLVGLLILAIAFLLIRILWSSVGGFWMWP
jgi:hypothetical protein